MTRTYGADDDVLCPINRQMFRKLRFQMIDDTGPKIIGFETASGLSSAMGLTAAVAGS
jgi:hypothetical protein